MTTMEMVLLTPEWGREETTKEAFVHVYFIQKDSECDGFCTCFLFFILFLFGIAFTRKKNLVSLETKLYAI